MNTAGESVVEREIEQEEREKKKKGEKDQEGDQCNGEEDAVDHSISCTSIYNDNLALKWTIFVSINIFRIHMVLW